VLEELLAGGAEENTPLPATVRVAPSRRATVALVALAALSALFLILSFALRRNSSPPIPELSVVRFPLVTDSTVFAYTELTTPFAVSPDGKTVVFVGTARTASGPQLLVATLRDIAKLL
jgi:hypothetical protein